MKAFRWSALKSERLKKTRGVSFEEIINEKLITIEDHPTRQNQEMMLFDRRGYIGSVPFVEGAGGIFLKTLYPSRHWTKKYLRGEL